VLKIWL